MIHRLLAAAAGIGLCACPTLARQATFLGFPDGVVTRDVSDDGQVVVGSTASGAFRWTAQGGLVQIGAGIATSVSADGTVIAGILPNGGVFRWTAATGETTVMTGADPNSVARASGDGRTIINGPRRWTAATGAVTLPNAPGPSGAMVGAYDVSYDGGVIAGAVGDSAGVQPFRWSASTATVSLGGFPGQRLDSTATAISADGNIIVGIGRTAHGYDAFRWTQQTGLVALSATGNGLSFPYPRAMNPDGSILVGTTGLSLAFVWRDGAGPEYIQDALEQHYGLDLTGWELQSAEGLSADGQTLVGLATSPNGQLAGYVVHLPWAIPAPGSATVLLMAGALARRRRR